MTSRRLPTDNKKIAFGSVPASYTDETLQRQYNWLEIINYTDEDINVSLDDNDLTTYIIPSGHSRVFENQLFEVLRLKYTDSAPTLGNLYYNCDFRLNKFK